MILFFLISFLASLLLIWYEWYPVFRHQSAAELFTLLLLGSLGLVWFVLLVYAYDSINWDWRKYIDKIAPPRN